MVTMPPFASISTPASAMLLFAAIDIFTREADILLAPALTAEYSCRFLNQSMRRRFSGHVNLRLMEVLNSRLILRVK